MTAAAAGFDRVYKVTISGFFRRTPGVLPDDKFDLAQTMFDNAEAAVKFMRWYLELDWTDDQVAACAEQLRTYPDRSARVITFMGDKLRRILEKIPFPFEGFTRIEVEISSAEIRTGPFNPPAVHWSEELRKIAKVDKLAEPLLKPLQAKP